MSHETRQEQVCERMARSGENSVESLATRFRVKQRVTVVATSLPIAPADRSMLNALRKAGARVIVASKDRHVEPSMENGFGPVRGSG